MKPLKRDAFRNGMPEAEPRSCPVYRSRSVAMDIFIADLIVAWEFRAAITVPTPPTDFTFSLLDCSSLPNRVRPAPGQFIIPLYGLV